MSRLLIKNAKALLGTHANGIDRIAGKAMAELPMLENAWLTAKDGRIEAIGPMSEAPDVDDWNDLLVIDAAGRYVLPGFCDPHTHTVFAASREGEFVDRIKGLTYQEIASKGGGILNSAGKLRDVPEDQLYEDAKARVVELMHMGTVALEIKSGYGLTLESELKMLRVVKRLKETMPIPIKATLLGAHALPPEYKENRKAYIDLVVNELIPTAAQEGLADYVDTFCETNYFTVEEMARVLEAGAKHGLPGKVHVNQFTSIGGIEAAVKHNAISVDHLEVMEPSDIDALRGTSVIPTLLPGCSLFLSIPFGPGRELINADLSLALATDFNPGSTPSGNMALVWSLGCIRMKLLPEEGLNACTLNAAAAMNLEKEVGSITPGKRASLIITKPVPSPAYLPYAFGSDWIDTVLIDGQPTRSGTALS